MAAVIALIFSRFFGSGIVWVAIMGDGFMREVKNAVEETTEALAMLIFLASMLEYWIAAHSREPRRLEGV